jgi:hypothetical protein
MKLDRPYRKQSQFHLLTTHTWYPCNKFAEKTTENSQVT